MITKPASFWLHASGLRNNETKYVVEVSYETDGPKGFDDVVVRYNPGNAARPPIVFIVAILGLSPICRVQAEGSNCI